MNILHWFRNDLRLHDNAAFANLEEVSTFLPVYIFDIRQFEKNELGFNKTGPFKARFLIESVTDLRNGLRAIGSDLLIRVGIPEDIIPQLIKEYNINKLTYQKEDTYDEIKIENEISKIVECEIEYFEGLTLFHPDDLPFQLQNLPDVFTDFRKKLEKESKIRDLYQEPAKLPKLPNMIIAGNEPKFKDLNVEDSQPDNRAAVKFIGGESAGIDRIENYFWISKNLKNYKFTRNGLLGESYSSKFSPWLAVGAISPRYIYSEVLFFENEIEKNVSTYWLVFELIWRDYFRFIAKKYGKKIFLLGGIKDLDVEFQHDKDKFDNWRLGNTGVPFVDANMKELLLTGFMSNRGRQNVASYLAKDLNLDWRWGAMWFENRLIDHDPCSNWGNWMYIAGVGNDPRDRKFDIESQRQKYDPENSYINHWLDYEPKLFRGY